MIPEKVAEPGRNKALAFTILVHAGLIAALFSACSGNAASRM